MLPGAQTPCVVDPVGQAEPIGHCVQSLCATPPAAPRYEPAAQTEAAAAPAPQNEPAGQLTHAVAPLDDWYVPAAQATHVSLPQPSLKVPGAHGVAAAEPMEHEVPGGHVTHCSTLVMTVSDEFLCVPPGHGSGAAAPSVQK